MAIKVKHDGNVTSRIYASAAGGKGKRQADDAIRLAQLQASAAGRSGGTGGGAHASATAPTTHAPTSHAQLGSTGSFISPQMSPETRMRLADDELTNKLIEMDNADAYRAAAQERQGDIDMEQIRERARLAEKRELTAQGRRERAALVNDVVDAIKQGRFSREEMPKLLERFGDAEDTIRMADALREREPTAEEAFRKSTFTDANGVVFGRDGKMLYNPNDAMMKQAEYEAKRLDALKARADKFELELRKPYKVTVGEGNDAIEQMQMRSEEEIMDLMKKHFPDLYPSAPAPEPSPEGEDTAGSSAAKYGLRPDGAPKGAGWLGELKLPNGGVATEYSVGVNIGGKEMDIPTLVPGLSQEQISRMVNDIIPNNKDVPKDILDIAAAHAKTQLAKGESVWANESAPPTEDPNDPLAAFKKYRN